MAITTGISCLTSRYGTGTESCQPVEGALAGFWLVEKGWTLTKASDTLDSTYVDEQIQLGKIIPFVGCFEGIVETPDATMQESQTGVSSVVRQGLPVFTFTFKKGLQFHKAAFSYNTDNEYDVVLVYKTGYLKVVESVDGTEIKALTVGMLNTNGYQENTGSASSQTVVKFQVTNESEYNKYSYLLTNLNFDPQSKNGITDVNIVIHSADVSDDSVVFSVVWKGNEQFSITGLDTTELSLRCNGVENGFDTITYSSSTGRYTGVPTTTLVSGQSAVTYTTGSVADDVAKLGSKFYRGESAGFTITA